MTGLKRAKTIFRSALRVSRDQLLLIVIQKEIEGIAQVHIDHDQVCIVHGEFSKTHLAVTKSNVIAGLLYRKVRGLLLAKDLNDLVALNANPSYLSLNMRWRQYLLRIEKQVIFVDRHAVNVFGVDQAIQINSQQIQ
jgi:hypothetical protein